MSTVSGEGVVADTNVITYLISNRPEHVELAERYRQHLENQPVAISFQTEAELRVGCDIQQWDRRSFESLMAGFEIVELSRDLLACYVQVRAESIQRQARGEGPRLDAADGWVAATALLTDRPLVTHDDKLSKSPLIRTITELGS